jgi:hypothetical protein
MNYQQLVTAIDSATQSLLGRAAQAVNQALVLRNWLIRAHLVEFEQSDEDRARYGEQLLTNLVGGPSAKGIRLISRTLKLKKDTRLQIVNPIPHKIRPCVVTRCSVEGPLSGAWARFSASI